MKKLLALAVLAVTILLVQPTGTASSAPAAPTAVQPPNGSRIESFRPTLTWTVPAGASFTQYNLKVVPANNDGPGVNLILAGQDTSFTIPAPPDWYGLLPDLTYTWQVRLSDATTSVGLDDASWSDWSAPLTFKTPLVSASTSAASNPAPDATGITLTPTLVWTESNPNVWYYEVQVSKDPAFGPGAFLYQELRHGGVTTPPRSYSIPSAFPLEPTTRYSWRVRPRIQGDGAVLPWGTAASFSTVAGTGGGGGNASGDVPAQVSAIISGDTIEVLIAGARRQVKYLGVAAPAVSPAECYAPQSAAINSQLVEGQMVRLSRDVSDTDAQGRLLRYVYVGDTFVNSALVQAGAARVRFEQPDVRFAQDFVALQTTAQQARAGLWGACP